MAANNNLFVVKNGIAVGNATSTITVINNAGQWVGDPTGVIQNSYNQANVATALAQQAYNQANTASGNTVALQGNVVALQSQVSTLNANVIAVNTFAQAAYNKANTGGGGSSGNFFTYYNSNTTLTTADSYVMLDTSSGPIYINLPVANSVLLGFSISVADGGGDKQVYPAYIRTTDESTINGINDTLNFNIPNTMFRLIFISPKNWKVTLNA